MLVATATPAPGYPTAPVSSPASEDTAIPLFLSTLIQESPKLLQDPMALKVLWRKDMSYN